MKGVAVDTTNRFLVAVQGDSILVMRPPLRAISYDEALNLAAWLVAVADGQGGQDFASVLDVVLQS